MKLSTVMYIVAGYFLPVITKTIYGDKMLGSVLISALYFFLGVFITRYIEED